MSRPADKNYKRLYQLRKIAIQIADQLPEDHDEARLVLQLTLRVFEDFLVKGVTPAEENAAGLALVK